MSQGDINRTEPGTLKLLQNIRGMQAQSAP